MGIAAYIDFRHLREKLEFYRSDDTEAIHATLERKEQVRLLRIDF